MTNHEQRLVLGAGLAGLSASYHLRHEAVVYEAKSHYGGHTHSIEQQGFVWDEGPHISFTPNEYVRGLFAEGVGGDYQEFEVRTANYYQGSWVDHPVQTSLHQVPEPLRSRVVDDMVATLSAPKSETPPKNYREWLHQALGPVFSDTFPAAYTRKYWTTDPANMSVDWVGPRMYRPSVDEVIEGSKGSLGRSTYYIQVARYPSSGGFFSYTHLLADGADIRYGKRLERANFGRRELWFADGSTVTYDELVATIPLPILIASAEDAPEDVREAAAMLRCSELLLVDVTAAHPTVRPEHWVYVYDEDKLSTRINFTERLSPNNAPPGATGLQVEVYGSAYRPLPADREALGRRVVEELAEMQLVESVSAVTSVNVRYIPWANVIFDLNRRDALARVDEWLDRAGVLRAGRYAEWKYLWTDGCVLSGRRVAESVDARI